MGGQAPTPRSEPDPKVQVQGWEQATNLTGSSHIWEAATLVCSLRWTRRRREEGKGNRARRAGYTQLTNPSPDLHHQLLTEQNREGSNLYDPRRNSGGKDDTERAAAMRTRISLPGNAQSQCLSAPPPFHLQALYEIN